MHARYAALVLPFLFLIGSAVNAQKKDPGYVAEDPELARMIGKPGPSMSLQTLDGKTIDLAHSYGQKPIYLKLWATYCLPCRAQMPGFEKIYETFGDRIQVVSVNAGVGDDIEKVRTFLTKNKTRIPVAVDDGSLGAWLKMEGTPFHLLIGRDGRIAYAGHQDGPALDKAIQHVLEDANASASAAPGASAPVATAKVESVATLRLGDRVPAIDVRRADGSTMQIQGGATGRPRAVLFTSVWCESYLKSTELDTVESCRRVREQVDQLSQADTVEWLGVATHLWTTPEDLGKYQAKMKTRVPMTVDSDGLAFRVFGIRRLPAVALIAADGRLVRIIGPDETDLAGAVATLGTPMRK
jgi:peroxiredoxin